MLGLPRVFWIILPFLPFGCFPCKPASIGPVEGSKELRFLVSYPIDATYLEISVSILESEPHAEWVIVCNHATTLSEPLAITYGVVPRDMEVLLGTQDRPLVPIKEGDTVMIFVRYYPGGLMGCQEGRQLKRVGDQLVKSEWDKGD
jgi:hypothetical protein